MGQTCIPDLEAGSVSAANDSVRRLQTVMIESGWVRFRCSKASASWCGHTHRSDHVAGYPPQQSQQAEVAALLEQAVSAPAGTVHQISETAHQMATFLFVGGLVRDLLLGSSIVDVDLVIEGDAIQLVRRLAAEMGGRVRAHRQFGTAKWLLSARVWRQIVPGFLEQQRQGALPASIDLVTARTEFYTHPTALPEVASSSIKQDLHRRDFTTTPWPSSSIRSTGADCLISTAAWLI
jgi:tRNA nucleotidyltransferase (CCA-adding enzyme)